MIPDHYILIFLGMMLGAPVGGFVIALLCHRRMKRISTQEWLAARKFYTGQPTNRFTL